MALTLRDLAEEAGLRVAAGDAGLDAPVRWVHISELADPTPWLSGGELLLTTGMGFAAGGGAPYVERLARHGLAGLGVGLGVGVLDALPPDTVAAAAEHGFPLLEVPDEVPFIAVTEKAFGHIVNEQAATLRRAIDAHERLERVVLSGRGLAGIAETLAELLDGGAAILGPRGQRLAHHGAGVDGPDALRLPVPRTGGGDGEPQAWLLARRAGGPPSELDRLVVHHAVTVVALELLRRGVAADTERRLAGDVLASLLSGELEGPELRRRLAPFGLGERVAALVLAPPQELKDRVEGALAAAARGQAGGGLAAGAGALSCALLPAPAGADDEELFGLAERVRSQVAAEVGRPLPAGAGRPVAPGGVRRAFHEARCALEARALDGGEDDGALATYRDLGSFQLLLSLQDDDALRLFCDSILSPVEVADGTYGGELMRSLEVFLECNGQWERAAKRLLCHRHTLRYRIRRIEELTGRSLDSARDRIDFWLALRARELIAIP